MTKPLCIHLSTNMLMCGEIRESGIPETDIVWAPDLLSLGPILPPWEPQHADARRNFWKQFYGSLFDTSVMPDAYESMVKALDKFDHADEIVIWAGPAMEEQFFFVWCVAVLIHHRVPKEKLRYLLVTEDAYWGRPLSFLNLSKEGLSHALKNGGRVLNENDFETLDKAWQTLCSTNPEEIQKCRKGTPPQLSLVFDRIGLLQRHYPNIRTGLNAFDYLLLQLCVKCGPRAIPICIEYLIYDHDEFDRPGDHILHSTLLKLASEELNHPLLELKGDISGLRDLSVTLTKAGKAVLLGEAATLN